MPTSKPQRNVPPGLELLCSRKRLGFSWHRNLVLILTFLSYAGYHASRKPPSIAKSVLRGDAGHHVKEGRALLSGGEVSVMVDTPEAHEGWAPFNGHDGQALLGQVDLAFLGAYAIGMFYAGHLGDRLDLRYFLSAGMIGSGALVSLFGMGYFWKVHNLSYYVHVSILAGLFQSTGWPSVVSIMANWFGKGKRGLIMGIWNAHTSVGNILGTIVAAACLSSGWGWSFMLPGLGMMVLGVVIFLFLVVQPSDVGLVVPDERPLIKAGAEEEELKSPYTTHERADADWDREVNGNGIAGDHKPGDKGAAKAHEESIHFMDAWRIPGVSQYAFCLFFAKLIAYTFLYWLPYYIKSTAIEGRLLSPKEAGDLSVLFDIGGVAGGVMAGHLSDKSGASALVSVSFTLCSVPVLWLYRTFGHVSFGMNIALMMLSGFCVNGPYALITTAVSADLGTHESLMGNSKALATVSAIIDGMGSIGAALGPMLTGYISQGPGGFDNVFNMLYSSAVLAGLLLAKLAVRELAQLRSSSTKRMPA